LAPVTAVAEAQPVISFIKCFTAARDDQKSVCRNYTQLRENSATENKEKSELLYNFLSHSRTHHGLSAYRRRHILLNAGIFISIHIAHTMHSLAIILHSAMQAYFSSFLCVTNGVFNYLRDALIIAQNLVMRPRVGKASAICFTLKRIFIWSDFTGVGKNLTLLVSIRRTFALLLPNAQNKLRKKLILLVDGLILMFCFSTILICIFLHIF
jgi:hypothetical protein